MLLRPYVARYTHILFFYWHNSLSYESLKIGVGFFFFPFLKLIKHRLLLTEYISVAFNQVLARVKSY